MSDTTDLAAAIQIRVAEQRLVHLTNHNTTTAITVDIPTLEASCDDAIGEFERITGLNAVIANRSHLAILTQGVLSFLEEYMNRDSGITTARSKRFFAACSSLRKTLTMVPVGNTPLVPSKQRQGSRPDMDRTRSPFAPATSRLRDYIEE